MFTNPYITDGDKLKFKKQFLDTYLKDENFRKEYENNYIIFVNNKLIGIFFNPYFDKIDSENVIKTVKIEENPNNNGMYYISQSIVKVKNKFSSAPEEPVTYNLANVTCNIKLSEECIISETKLIDTGASTTSLFYINKE